MIIAAHMYKRNYEKALIVGKDFIEQGLKDKSTRYSKPNNKLRRQGNRVLQ